MPRASTARIQTADDLGRAIRARRTALGLDQGALARLAGVSRQWIVEVERGKPRAEVGLLLRTLQALRLDLALKPAPAAVTPQVAPSSEPARPVTMGGDPPFPLARPAKPVPEVYAPGLVDLDALIRRARGQEP